MGTKSICGHGQREPWQWGGQEEAFLGPLSPPPHQDLRRVSENHVVILYELVVCQDLCLLAIFHEMPYKNIRQKSRPKTGLDLLELELPRGNSGKDSSNLVTYVPIIIAHY